LQFSLTHNFLASGENVYDLAAKREAARRWPFMAHGIREFTHSDCERKFLCSGNADTLLIYLRSTVGEKTQWLSSFVRVD
jgi:hypothetical protein